MRFLAIFLLLCPLLSAVQIGPVTGTSRAGSTSVGTATGTATLNLVRTSSTVNWDTLAVAVTGSLTRSGDANGAQMVVTWKSISKGADPGTTGGSGTVVGLVSGGGGASSVGGRTVGSGDNAYARVRVNAQVPGATEIEYGDSGWVLVWSGGEGAPGEGAEEWINLPGGGSVLNTVVRGGEAGKQVTVTYMGDDGVATVLDTLDLTPGETVYLSYQDDEGGSFFVEEALPVPAGEGGGYGTPVITERSQVRPSAAFPAGLAKDATVQSVVSELDDLGGSVDAATTSVVSAVTDVTIAVDAVRAAVEDMDIDVTVPPAVVDVDLSPVVDALTGDAPDAIGDLVDLGDGPALPSESEVEAWHDATFGDLAADQAANDAILGGAGETTLGMVANIQPMSDPFAGVDRVYSMTIPVPAALFTTGEMVIDVSPWSDALSIWRACAVFFISVCTWIAAIKIIRGAFAG